MSLGGIVGRVTQPSVVIKSTAAIMGQPLGYGTNYKEVVLAAATTTVPLGIAAQAGAQDTHIGMWLPGCLCTGLAQAAITKGTLLVATTGGKFITGTKGGTQTQTDYCWGSAFSAAGADLDYFEIAFNWFEMEVT